MIFSIGVILGLININLPITNEILARTQPTIIDLMIALAGGAAGALPQFLPDFLLLLLALLWLQL
jgi:uncharacterized membrane protein